MPARPVEVVPTPPDPPVLVDVVRVLDVPLFELVPALTPNSERPPQVAAEMTSALVSTMRRSNDDLAASYPRARGG
jgi:hypothetical protein